MKKTSFPVLSEQIEFRELSNGLRICVLPRRRVRTVMMQAWVATGSIHEEEHLGRGLSHIMEHMLFQGCAGYPGTRVTELAREWSASLNAYTSFDRTVITVGGPAGVWPEALAMALAMARAPEGAAWVTVMTNANVVAVASLAEVACVVLAEGYDYDEAALKAAKGKVILLRSGEPIYETAVKIGALL